MSSEGTPFGRFVLLECVARGGMGEVFLAREPAPDGGWQTVAVKRLVPKLAEDDEVVADFLREASLGARLSHRHIVGARDFGLEEESGAYFLSMEYVSGRPLDRLISTCRRRKERVPVALAREIVLRICEGMAYAHAATDEQGRPLRLVHRDLNPSNVLISFSGDVKVIDFGIATSELSGGQTDAGLIKGKFDYMSPEQSVGKEQDGRSDIFAAGVTLYELLTGTNPFERASPVLSLEAIQRFEPPLPGRDDEQLAPFDPILERALRKDPERRYQDMAEMAEEMRALVLPPAGEHLGQFAARLLPDAYAKEKARQQMAMQSPPPAVVADDGKGGTVVIDALQHRRPKAVSDESAPAENQTLVMDAPVGPAASPAALPPTVVLRPGAGADDAERTVLINGVREILQRPARTRRRRLLMWLAVGAPLAVLVGIGAWAMLRVSSVAPVSLAGPESSSLDVAPAPVAEVAVEMAVARPIVAMGTVKDASPVRSNPGLSVVMARATPQPVVTAEYGSVLLKVLPEQPVRLNGREFSGSGPRALLPERSGRFEIGEAASPHHVTVSYEVLGERLSMRLTGSPGTTARIDGEPIALPAEFELSDSLRKVELARDGEPRTVAVVLKYAKP